MLYVERENSGHLPNGEQEGDTSEIMETSIMEGEEYYNQEGGEWTQKVDTGQLCRVCANPNDYLIPIFDGEGLEHELSMKIQKHLPIKVTETDTLPQHMCYQCASTLIAWHDLVISCVEADKKLRELQMEENDDDDDKGGEMFESPSLDSEMTDDVIQPSTSETQNQNQVSKTPSSKKAAVAKEKKSKLKMILVKGPPAGTSGQKTASKTQVAKALELAKSKDGVSQDSASERHDQESWTSMNSLSQEEVDNMRRVKEREFHILSDHSYIKSDYEPFGGSYKEDALHDENENLGEVDGQSKVKEELVEDTDQDVSIYSEIQSKNGSESSKRQPLHIICVKTRNLYDIPGNFTEKKSQNVLVSSKRKAKWIYVSKKLNEDVSETYTKEELKTEIGEWEGETSHDSASLTDHTQPPYICEQCGKSCESSSSFNEHLATHTSSFDYTCVTCKRSFSERNDYKEHIANHSTERLYLCQMCGKTFKSNGSLLSHLRTHCVVNRCICHICGKQCKNSTLLRLHMNTHSGEKNFPCITCGKNFATRSNLRYHAISHSEQRPHECEICGKMFKRKSNLEEHQARHIPEKDNACYICNNSFSSVSALERHLASHTQKEISESEVVKKTVKCDICLSSFSSKLSLALHLKDHSGETMYPCQICKKHFKTQAQLDTHSKSHESKKFVCMMCGKELSLRKTLIEHERIHTGEQPFPCSECGRRFRSLSGLHAHRALHSEERPFACTRCGAQFRRRTYLISHIRTHTGEKPHVCNICQRPFAQRSDMVKHRARHSK
ncbi:zinc finger protein 235-like isoform X7 [Periplaneta americana]|uniref:zinc finger protein 235-like isoform X7 n=1 Tax=Periplaneta americana TaxID=6978 RepID=UPI0037E8670C